MRIDECLKDNAEIMALAKAMEVGASKAILKVIIEKQKELSKRVNDNPERNDQFLKKDVVYLLGRINALLWVASLPDQANKLIQRLEDY